MRFFSRNNSVHKVMFEGQACVRKLFFSPENCLREQQLLHEFSAFTSVPRIIRALPGVLLLEYKPQPTLLEELERQEHEGFRPEPWQALRRWIVQVYEKTSLLPGDGNLRNFLWDAQSGVCGLDFEHYAHGQLCDTLAQIAAFILEYSPENTPVKQEAAGILFCGDTEAARAALRNRRRQRRKPHPFSFILLARGASRRMGRDKAELPFLGSTLLELQLEKALLLSCDDVLISGRRSSVPGARIIPDEIPGCGPLGGLHACLRQAAHPECVVMSVDLPLLPACALRDLQSAHESDITLAVHGGHWEPLVGVYNASLADQIPPMIRSSGHAFWEKFEYIVCDEMQNLVHYQGYGSKELLMLAETTLRSIAASGRTKIVALSATPQKIRKRFGALCYDVAFDSDNLVQYETAETIPYTGVEAILLQSLGRTGILYTQSVTDMLKYIAFLIIFLRLLR